MRLSDNFGVCWENLARYNAVVREVHRTMTALEIGRSLEGARSIARSILAAIARSKPRMRRNSLLAPEPEAAEATGDMRSWFARCEPALDPATARAHAADLVRRNSGPLLRPSVRLCGESFLRSVPVAGAPKHHLFHTRDAGGSCPQT
jgi:hypothetical protein